MTSFPGTKSAVFFSLRYLCCRSMGTGSSVLQESTEIVYDQEKRCKEIDQELEADRRKTVLKLLLLGPGNSGKSTTLKQLRIIHDTGFSDSERLLQKGTIYISLIGSVVEFVDVLRERHSFKFTKQFLEDYGRLKLFYELHKVKTVDVLPVDEANAIERILNNPAIKEVLVSNVSADVDDSAIYFFTHFERLRKKDYIPTTDDVLRTRIPTMGVVQYSIVINKFAFRIFDVGGQKTQRRKWIHLFDNVNAVLFITSLSEYNETLAEETGVNRMQDSLALFNDICNNEWLNRTSMILFLNKIDLFRKKIQHVPITVALKNYKGKQEYRPSLDYIAKKYKQVNKNPGKKIYIHETCATDTQQVEVVINLVVTMVIDSAMQQIGLQ